MTAKRYLSELKLLNTCIEQKIQEKAALYSSGLQSAAPERERMYGNREKSIPRLVDRIIELENTVNQQIDCFVNLKHAIIDQIQGMNREAFAAVLYKRYVEDKRLTEIAAEMNYTYKYVSRVHGQALQAFGRQYAVEIAAYEEAKRLASESGGTKAN